MMLATSVSSGWDVISLQSRASVKPAGAGRAALRAPKRAPLRGSVGQTGYDFAARARARWPLDPAAEPAPGAGVKA
jgi:hypothetical protein